MTALWTLTAAEIAAGVRGRRFSAREAAQSVLNRIDAANVPLNAVVDRFDAEALAEADAVDAAVSRGEDPGPLAGVPVTTKVNVDQTGRATTNGLRLQRDLVAAEDNPVVANLRRAGAVIVGRTNTPAFSLRWFTRNSLHGATTNPRAPGLTPGGSSGGAGAAVAAGMGAIAHGTDIAGSVRYPAYACGVHGLRPTLGRVAAWNSTSPDRHIGAQLTAVSGPLARSIEDLRLALAAMAAPDPRDPWSVPAPLAGGPLPRRVAFCPAPDGMPISPEVADALRAAADRLCDLGWDVAETPCPPLREAARLQLLLWLSEGRRSGNRAFAEEGDPDALTVMARLGALAPEADLATFMDALQRRVAIAREWRMLLADRPLILMPVSGSPPFPDHADVGDEAAFAAVWEAQAPQVGLPLTGLPALSVCTGAASGAPMGVQLVAPPFREDWLFTAAEALAAPCPPVGA